MSFRITKDKERASFFGKMAKNILVNGKMEKSMVKETGNHLMEIFMMANGFKAKLKVMEFISYRMGKPMKVFFMNF